MHEVYTLKRLPGNALYLMEGEAIVPISFDEFIQALSKCFKDHASVLIFLIR